jgi:hypothetical protein
MEKVNIEKGYYTFTITDSWGHGLKMVTLAHTVYKLEVILFLQEVISNMKRSFPFLFSYELVFTKFEFLFLWWCSSNSAEFFIQE